MLLESFLKQILGRRTCGSRGIHVLVVTSGNMRYSECRQYTKNTAWLRDANVFLQIIIFFDVSDILDVVLWLAPSDRIPRRPASMTTYYGELHRMAWTRLRNRILEWREVLRAELMTRIRLAMILTWLNLFFSLKLAKFLHKLSWISLESHLGSIFGRIFVYMFLSRFLSKSMMKLPKSVRIPLEILMYRTSLVNLTDK